MPPNIFPKSIGTYSPSNAVNLGPHSHNTISEWMLEEKEEGQWRKGRMKRMWEEREEEREGRGGESGRMRRGDSEGERGEKGRVREMDQQLARLREAPVTVKLGGPIELIEKQN